MAQRKPAVVDPALEERLAKNPGGVRAVVTAWTRDELAQIKEAGVKGTTLRVLPMVLTESLTAEQLERLRRSPAIRSIWGEEPTEFHMQDSTWLVKARETWRGLLQGGFGVTGKDVHVAVLDTGIDGGHEDADNLVEYCEATQTLSLFMLNCSPFDAASGNLGPAGPFNDARRDAAADDPLGLGHGSHVSGTIAGTGQGSGGIGASHSTIGMAPEAKLHVYSLNVSLAIQYFASLVSYDDLILKKKTLNSGVIAVNNSYGGGAGAEYDADAPREVAKQEAYKAGILSVFAAGNSGPAPNTLSSDCVSPWIVCVASSTKAETLSNFSSRGRPSEHADTNGDGIVFEETGSNLDIAPANHDRLLGQQYKVGLYRPTLTAPGSSINSISANAPSCREGADSDSGCYASVSGTSMATPHVVGAVALIVQAYRETHGGADPSPATLIEILERSANLSKMPGYEAEEQGAGRLDAYEAVRFARTHPAGLGPPNFGFPTPPYTAAHPGQHETIQEEPGCTGTGTNFMSRDPSGRPRFGQHFIDVPEKVERLRVRWDFPPSGSQYRSVVVQGAIIGAWQPGVDPDAMTAPAGPGRSFQSHEGTRELDIRSPEPGRWTFRMAITQAIPTLPCNPESKENPKQTEGFNYILRALATRVPDAPTVNIDRPLNGSPLSGPTVSVEGTAGYPTSWDGVTNWEVTRTGTPGVVTAPVFDPTFLYFDGNTGEGGCTGDGATDVVACNGPFLRTEEKRVLSPQTAASWKVPDPLLSDTDARSTIDPNWIWVIEDPATAGDEMMTLSGPMTINWWTSCAICSIAAEWRITLYADNTNVFEQRLSGLGEVSSTTRKLAATVEIPYAQATDAFVLKIDPLYFDVQPATSIYYDSANQCPAAHSGGPAEPCDSLVVMPVVSNDFVPPTPPATDGPPPPKNVRVTDLHSGLRVAWEAPADTGTFSYRIHKSTTPDFSPTPSNLIATTEGTACSSPDVPSWPTASRPALCYTDTSVDDLTTYYYRVIAVLDGTVGDPSLLTYGTPTRFDRHVRLKIDRLYGRQVWEYASLLTPAGRSWAYLWETLELSSPHDITARSFSQGIGSAGQTIRVDLTASVEEPGQVGREGSGRSPPLAATGMPTLRILGLTLLMLGALAGFIAHRAGRLEVNSNPATLSR